jgi:hypothetical protein
LQQVVLAKKIIIMCGLNEVLSDNIKIRLRDDGVYGLNWNTREHRPLRVHSGTVIDGMFKWPDAEHDLFNAMQCAQRPGLLR